MKKALIALTLLLSLCLVFSGCSAASYSNGSSSSSSATPPPLPTPTPPAGSSSVAAAQPSSPASSPDSSETHEDLRAPVESGDNAPTIPPEIQDETPSGWEGGGYPGDSVYIGTKSGEFAASPSMLPKEDVTPEALIARIAELTGWDLTLAEPVTTGKGGMSVCLASTSALFQGPPENQKDEFHMYSADQMAETVLDSIQKTLQEGFTGAGGDPNNIDIYFYMEGEQPLSISNIGLSWPLDQPYQWANAITE